MSINRLAIASSLASYFGQMSAPSGEPALAFSTYELPDQIAQTPCVLVFPPEEQLSYPPSMRSSLQEWTVRFYIQRTADMKRQVTSLYRWADVLIPQLDGLVHLGLSDSVNSADVAGARTGPIVYANETFDGIEVSVLVNAQEAVTFSN